MKKDKHQQFHELMQYFRFKHLPEHLQEVSRKFAEVARWVVNEIPDNCQKDECLKELLAAKDCAVRAKLHVDESDQLVARPG